MVGLSAKERLIFGQDTASEFKLSKKNHQKYRT